jgi:mono/diheme cytochrome c family protein
MKIKTVINTLGVFTLASIAMAGPVSAQTGAVLPDEQLLAAGFRALESSCFACHSPDAAMNNRIAPPMAAIKKHYLDEDTSYETFRRQLVDFVDNPSAENTRMPGAIRKFGLMPKLSLERRVVEEIAYYIYHSELEAPDWFEQHYQQEQRRNRRMTRPALNTPADYLAHGREIAMSTKAVLGSNLKQAINTGGTVSAIGFCRENATPIARRMSQELNASVTRVSDRPRNPKNQADPAQMRYIVAARAALAQGEQAEPEIQEIGNRMVAYYPIVTNAMCLQCHGVSGRDISEDTARALDASYPNDLARGYGIDELRGIFVVSMEKGQ